MKVGTKAQGQRSHEKLVVQRHGHKRGVSRRSYAAAEKAAETRVRQAGRRSIATELADDSTSSASTR